MIDLHCHLLPAVDDGSRSVQQSVEVLERMAREGVRAVCLTPHLMASRISEGPPPAHDEAYSQLAAQAPSAIALHRGAEILLDRRLTARVVSTRRVTLAGTRFVLVEFTRMVTVAAASAALGEITAAGLVPVLAHPERYAACSVGVVRAWREGGALMQVDATTVFQPTTRGQKARDLLAAGQADILASDNHGDTRSLPLVFERLAALGTNAATLLMVANPEAILADRSPEVVPPVDVKLPLGGRMRTWWERMRQ